MIPAAAVGIKAASPRLQGMKVACAASSAFCHRCSLTTSNDWPLRFGNPEGHFVQSRHPD
jgi:hypothetical protein